ncbi:free fatty acid receptor 2-like [Platysternon megacephalum]|uniref:Free fatty acid receptor 2-like n=1 Tax=Platysternon megacephalum TaxID=55544 RepID=A0A4D9DPR1_9SAUR|nr:free fatty acid receptor 2-like [Platysternon megacephalum]
MPSKGLASESNSEVITPLTALGPSVHYLQMHLPLGCHGVKMHVAITTLASAGGRAVWGECPITVSEGADPERQWCMGTSPGGGRERIPLPFQCHGASKQRCLLGATSFSLSLVIPSPSEPGG